MTTTVDSTVFVDTNILVYFTFDHFSWHAAARERLAGLNQLQVPLCTSRQVLREFLAVTTRPNFMLPLPAIALLTEAVRSFENRLGLLEDDRAVTSFLLELMAKPGCRGRQVHDANIVATMRQHRITYLLTHNVSDFRRYEPWITVLPLIPDVV